MIKALFKKTLSERQRNTLYYSYFKLRGFFYRGKGHYCVCCNTSFRTFLTYGNIPRVNALCPSCHSLERTRVLMYYLQNAIRIFEKNLGILHFAPEPIIEKKIKQYANIKYISADINPYLADQVIDITNIPFEDNSFDIVICSHVLGHVPDEKKAIDEIYRVLKSGGEAIIMTVIGQDLEHTYEDSSISSPSDRLKKYGEPDLLRLHGKDFDKRLERKSVAITVKDYRLTFTENEQLKYCLGNGNREVIFSCMKK